MTLATTFRDETVAVAGGTVHYRTAGTGTALLVLHGEDGDPGWLDYHDALAQIGRVIAPIHPGYDDSERPDWVETCTDLAHFYLQFLSALGVTRSSLVGFSLGAWVAAEMAALCSHPFERLVLVAAAGIKPVHGEIAEVFMKARPRVVERSFYDPSRMPEAYRQISERPPGTPLQDREWHSKTMAARLAWKPYFNNPKLAYYLRRCTVPSLIVWGAQDAIIPVECADLYHQALQNSTVRLIDECGHLPEVEKPEELIEVVAGFIRQGA